MAQKLFPIPANMLGGFVRKAALYLPPEQRTPIMMAAQSKAKPNPLLEKTKLIITCVLAAKQHEDIEAFKADIHEAVSTMDLTINEYALFDGFLGAKQGMLLEMAKRGVSKERLDLIRAELPARLKGPLATLPGQTKTPLAETKQG